MNRNFLSLRISTLVAAVSLAGCGRSGPASVVLEAPGVGGLPGYIANPDTVVRPAPGSGDVWVDMRLGSYNRSIMIRLIAEDHAEPEYLFRDPDASGPEALRYQSPLVLFPPADLWVRSTKQNQDGPWKKIEFGLSSDGGSYLEPSEEDAPRGPMALPHQRLQLPSLDTESLSDSLKDVEDLTQVADPQGDMPLGMEAVDITHFALEDEGESGWDLSWTVAETVADDPRIRNRTWGVEIGSSGITSASFGSGVSHLYTVEVSALGCTVEDASGNPIWSSSEGSSTYWDRDTQSVHCRVPLDSLPDLKSGTNLVARPFATQNFYGTSVRDGVLPVFLRSSLRGVTTQLEGDDDRPSFVLYYPDGDRVLTYLHGHLADSSDILDAVEATTGMTLHGIGSVPIFGSASDVGGFAGLNTSDRGILSTLRPHSPPIAVTQLMAHELAHYANAWLGHFADPWVLEGHSEWVAERVLYKYYPPRAVHRYLDSLRRIPFVQGSQDLGGDDKVRLLPWDQGSPALAYAKAWMFVDALALTVGDRTLRRAWRHGRNERMSTKDLQSFLEQESAEDLATMFGVWVDGNVGGDDVPRPSIWISDEDQDSLTWIDEKRLGTSSSLWDTDGDGASDGEEYFRDRDPLEWTEGVSAAPDYATDLLHWRREVDTDADEEAVYCLASSYRDTCARRAGSGTFLHRPYVVTGRLGTQRVEEYSSDGQLRSRTWPVINMMLPQTPRTAAATLASPTLDDGSASSVEDTEGDLPYWLDSFDIHSWSIREDGNRLIMTLTPQGSPDPYGTWGDFEVSLDWVTWSDATGPSRERRMGLKLRLGGVSVLDESGSDSTVLQLGSKLEVEHNDTSWVVTLPIESLAPWRDTSGASGSTERVVCISSVLPWTTSSAWIDHGGCLTIESQHVHRRGQKASAWGEGTIFLDLFSAVTHGALDEWVGLGVDAVERFGALLQRPIIKRNLWPIHISPGVAGFQSAGAGLSVGAYLARSASDRTAFDYSFVEQLARLYLTTLLDWNEVAPPLWIQELFVQWLTLHVRYGQSRTSDLQTWLGGLIGAYPSSYTGDPPLAEWVSPQTTTTAPIKARMLAMYLDASLGTATCAKVMSSFDSALPLDSAELRGRFLAEAPDKASQIAEIWRVFVDGSGNASQDTATIGAWFGDGADGDGVLQFQEQILGDSSQSQDYFQAKR